VPAFWGPAEMERVNAGVCLVTMANSTKAVAVYPPADPVISIGYWPGKAPSAVNMACTAYPDESAWEVKLTSVPVGKGVTENVIGGKGEYPNAADMLSIPDDPDGIVMVGLARAMVNGSGV